VRKLEPDLVNSFGPYALVMATLAITLDRRLAVSSALCVAGSVLTQHAIDQAFWIVGATHVVSCLVVVYVWRPEILIRPRAERELARASRE